MVILNIIDLLLQLFRLALLARIILSWFPNVDRRNPIIQFLYDITEPVLRPVREMLPPGGMFDFSPLIVFVIIQVISTVLHSVRF
ncbi:MAG: YggT family protein [Chloroflexi bacterium]|nr:YggT family protein [Chloroflexota bacterium]MCC6896988.1 YggT family protein [Anaerolineae bacterium]